MPESTIKKIKREFQGVVVSTRMEKTAVVLVERMIRHPRYKKQYRQSRKYKVHDEKNECQVGQAVIFRECRPISRDKRWRLIKIVK